MLFMIFLLSILVGQVTILDKIRISIPTKELASLIFIVFSLKTLSLKTNKPINYVVSFLFIFYIASITLVYIIEQNLEKVDQIYVLVVLSYSLVYYLGILFVFTGIIRQNNLWYLICGYRMLLVTIYIAIVLYVLFLLNFNPLLLGINHAAIYRGFGLYAEPSHFSIFCVLAFWLMPTMVDFNLIEKPRYYHANQIIILLGLILSASPTGLIFFVATFILRNLTTLLKSFMVVVVVATFVWILVSFTNIDIVARNLARILSEYELLLSLLAQSNSDDIAEFSRLGRLVLSIKMFLSNVNNIQLIFGTGVGGQVLVFETLNIFLPAPVALLAELGLVGVFLLLITILKLNLYRYSFPVLFILAPYLGICLLNGPGGIFYAQFIAMMTLYLSIGRLALMKRNIKKNGVVPQE